MCRYRALVWTCGHSRTFRLSTCRATKQTWRQFGHELRRRVSCTGTKAQIWLRLSGACKDCRRVELRADIVAQWAENGLLAAQVDLAYMEAYAVDAVDEEVLDWVELVSEEREKYRLRCVHVRNWIVAPEHALPGPRSSPARTKCATPSLLGRDLEGNPAWDDKIPIQSRVRAHLVE
ncbi:hypothetical protein BU16DRAFT_562157 [Lophium mytilinum]|uniref:Uncharacterized protein n=1 Tax=Lophium mytilinum TaxID=390894 RepID=A0A6A6QR63_9PEZI|nr:hypothetical protein BU16DRAFT_562157 [Lophium mytilinum]